MDEVTVPIPSDRIPEFFALYAKWLAAPAGADWSHSSPSPTAVQKWDPGRAGEFQIGSQLWIALSEPQRTLLDAVAASGKVEAAQLSQALGLGGAIAVVQQAIAINAAASLMERADVLLLTMQANSLVLELDEKASKVLLREVLP